MVITTSARAWTPEAKAEHERICQALAAAGSRLRRCNGLEPPPPLDIRTRREMPVITQVPMGYLVLWRRENEEDAGIFRAVGPNGWQKDFVTWTLAEQACIDHYHQPVAEDPPNEDKVPFEDDEDDGGV